MLHQSNNKGEIILYQPEYFPFCVIFAKKTAMQYTAIIQKTEDGWYIGQCEQIPGALTQGKTIEEVKENLKEAIQLVLETEKDLCKEQYRGEKIYS